MLRKFRDLRKVLLQDGAVKKYLLYAVGEILLVMIGILLALQVNNWNENRKLRIEEKKLLIDLKEGLISDRDEQIENHLGDKYRRISRLDVLISSWENKSSYHDSLRPYFGILSRNDDFIWQKVAYKNLESKGLDIIRNDSLKKEIINLFEVGYVDAKARFDNKRENLLEYGRPIVRSLFKRLPGEGFEPVDYASLLEDVEYWNTLIVLRENNQSIMERLSWLKEHLDILIDLIDAEIQK